MKIPFRWQAGRQQSGYEKMFLLCCPWVIKFDVYLLRFKPGSEIKPHIDPVTDARHYRLNLVLKHAKQGGAFTCDQPIYVSNRIKLFRPDVSEHSVTRVIEGTRYVFSIGWVRKAVA